MILSRHWGATLAPNFRGWQSAPVRSDSILETPRPVFGVWSLCLWFCLGLVGLSLLGGGATQDNHNHKNQTSARTLGEFGDGELAPLAQVVLRRVLAPHERLAPVGGERAGHLFGGLFSVLCVLVWGEDRLVGWSIVGGAGPAPIGVVPARRRHMPFLPNKPTSPRTSNSVRISSSNTFRSSIR